MGSSPNSSWDDQDVLAYSAQSVAHQSCLEEEVDKADNELFQMDQLFQKNPSALESTSARMAIRNVLNYPLQETNTLASAHTLNHTDSPALLLEPPYPTICLFLPPSYPRTPLSYQLLAEFRLSQCEATNVNSEWLKLVNVTYADKKFKPNLAARQLSSHLQDNEHLRSKTSFHKARYKRWTSSGPPISTRVGCELLKKVNELAGM